MTRPRNGREPLAGAGHVRYSATAGGDTLIELNTNNTFDAEATLTLSEVHTLSAANFG